MQLTAFIDAWIASWLPTGAVAALSNAQLLYTLPISLFGISISAAELPAMSGDAASDAGMAALRTRLDSALERMAFFVIPSAVAFVALGTSWPGLLRPGASKPDAPTSGDSRGIGGGLLASTMARLYSWRTMRSATRRNRAVRGGRLVV